MSPTTESTFAPYTRLSPSVYLIPPHSIAPNPNSSPQPPSPSTSKTPSTIILCFWYSAPARALVKYATQYAHLAPSSRIIFILTGPREIYLHPTRASHRRRLQPVVDLLQSNTTAGEDEEEEGVHIHLFSNGGLFTTAHLLLAYKHAAGKPLRVSSMLLDSAPGVAAPSKSLTALAYGLPRTLIVRQVLYGVLALAVWGGWFVRKLILRREDPFAFARRAVLDGQLVIKKSKRSEKGDNGGGGVKSCYFYSKTDDLIPWTDIEEHAALAVVKGRQVDLEEFQGSPHVGHMRHDPERYWAIVARYLFRSD